MKYSCNSLTACQAKGTPIHLQSAPIVLLTLWGAPVNFTITAAVFSALETLRVKHTHLHLQTTDKCCVGERPPAMTHSQGAQVTRRILGATTFTKGLKCAPKLPIQ